MQMAYALMIFLGLAFNGFVMMMNKGATLSDLTFKKALGFTLIGTGINIASLLAGYGISMVLRGFLSEGSLTVLAYFALLFLGVFLSVRAANSVEPEEKADRNFGCRECFLYCMKFFVGVVIVGVGCFLLNFKLLSAVRIVMNMSLVLGLLSLYLGYHEGSRWSKPFGMGGGIMIVLFTVVRFMMYLAAGV